MNMKFPRHKSTNRRKLESSSALCAADYFAVKRVPQELNEFQFNALARLVNPMVDVSENYVTAWIVEFFDGAVFV